MSRTNEATPNNPTSRDNGRPIQTGSAADDVDDPAGYPWTAVRTSTLVAGGRRFRLAPGPTVREVDDLRVLSEDHDRSGVDLGSLGEVLVRHDVGPAASRQMVIAVGSNASPAVIESKLGRAGVSTVVPLVIIEVDGIAAGHSAHVSAPGYIPAAPHPSEGFRTMVGVLLDPDQLVAVDATEPSYRRLPVTAGGGSVRHMERHEPTATMYASRWGVLATKGEPLPLMAQPALHQRLRSLDERFADTTRGMSTAEVVEALRHGGVDERWGPHWAATGLAMGVLG